MSLDFLVVGAQKAGTTSLHDWLAQQPGVALPTIKETHYFSHDERHRQGPQWYQQQFARQAPRRGEVDPEYMYVPTAAGRIAAHGGTAALVFLLRDPLERAYSHFQMSRRRGLEPLPFAEALQAEAGRLDAPDEASRQFAQDHWSYLDRGDYARQIQRMAEQLPAAAQLFVRFEDLVSTQHAPATYARIAAFIALEQATPPLAQRSNAASEPRSLWLNRLLWQGGGLRKAAGRLIPSQDVKRRMGIWLDRMNQRPPRSAERLQDLELPAWVRARLAQQIVATQRQTDLDLAPWLARLDRFKWAR